jgi:hypothetical protein
MSCKKDSKVTSNGGYEQRLWWWVWVKAYEQSTIMGPFIGPPTQFCPLGCIDDHFYGVDRRCISAKLCEKLDYFFV